MALVNEPDSSMTKTTLAWHLSVGAKTAVFYITDESTIGTRWYMPGYRTQRLVGITSFVLLLMSVAVTLQAADYRPLIGQWQRTDGGYIIEIRRVASDGTMTAAYYNPRPINVARAEATTFKKHLKVEIELRDSGYPGSIYTLVYNAEKDILVGFYYHAVQRQSFDVVFTRRPNS